MTIDDIKEMLPPSLVKELGDDKRILEFYNANILTDVNSKEYVSLDDIYRIVPPKKIRELDSDEAIKEYYNKHYVKNDIANTNDNKIIMYHGSNMRVKSPIIKSNGYTKDFGYGFYVTNKEEQARAWAKRKAHNNQKGCISIYKLDKSYIRDLRVKRFESMTEEWLDFIAACRYGKTHTYDIVEGPMADDTIYRVINNFMNNDISREEFWSFCRFKYPTHQMVFCTEVALKYLEFAGGYYV